MELGRWQLLRAYGRVAADPAAMAELGLLPAGETEHAEVFVVNCPPYPSLYLGEEFPGEDLAVLLDRYARLGETGEDDARRVLFSELLWPWLPAYLGAVADLPSGPLTGWAELTLAALRHEREQLRSEREPELRHERDRNGRDPGEPLPRALRVAPPSIESGVPDGPDGLAEGLLTPLRSGMILTRRAVAAGAEQVGAGQRTGNRRRALAAMLAAEPERAACWLAGQADHWAGRHRAIGDEAGAGADKVQLWWAERAAGTARLVRSARVQHGICGFRGDSETAGVCAAD